MPIRRSFSLFLRLLGATLLLVSARPALAGPDFWTLSMVWSPEYCNSNLTSKEPQCVEERYFTLYSLIPNYLAKAPACTDSRLDEDDIVRWFAVIPNRARINRVWKNEGACSGLDQREYFVQMERANRRLLIPERYAAVETKIDVSREEFRQAFIRENPGLSRESMALRCHGRWLSEVQVCLNSDFSFRDCGLPENCKEQIRIRPLRKSREGLVPTYR